MEFSAAQIADFLNGEVVGDASIKVNNLSKIDDGKPNTLSFLANDKYSNYIYNTDASIVLVKRNFIAEQSVKCTLIKVDDPYACLAMLLNMISQARKQKSGIDKNSSIAASAQVSESIYIGAYAVIDEGASVAEGCKIYPQVYIGDNVKIGENCTIYSGAKIYSDTVIGKNVVIHSGAVIGADGFGFAPVSGDYMKIPQIGNVVIEDDVEIGANTTIDRATMGSTIIRKGTKLDNLIQVGHNVEIGSNTVIAGLTGVAGSTKIGNNCMIAGQVGVAGHIKVGDRVKIGAQSGIPNNVKDDMTVMGYPAIPALDFAKQVVLQKRLPKMNSDIDALKKSVETLLGEK